MAADSCPNFPLTDLTDVPPEEIAAMEVSTFLKKLIVRHGDTRLWRCRWSACPNLLVSKREPVGDPSHRRIGRWISSRIFRRRGGCHEDTRLQHVAGESLAAAKFLHFHVLDTRLMDVSETHREIDHTRVTNAVELPQLVELSVREK